MSVVVKQQKGKIFLMTTDKIRLTTLKHSSVPIRQTNRCPICNHGRRPNVDNVCYNVGQFGHSTMAYKTETSSSPVGLLKRELGDVGILKQEICAYSSLFHMTLKLTEGKAKDQVAFTIDMEGCTESKGKYKAFPSKIRSVFIKLKFLDKRGQVAETKYMTTVQKNPNAWKDLRIVNDHFCSVEMIKRCLQTEAYLPLKEMTLDSPTTDIKPIPYEFIECQLEAKLEVENHAKFWLSGQTCKCLFNAEDNHHQRQSFIIHQELKLNQSSFPSVFIPTAESFSFTSSSSSSSTSSGEPSPKKTRSEIVGTTADSSSSLVQTAFVSKYVDLVTLTLGGPYDLQFHVPKFLLVDQSPVFKAMFESNFQERRTGEVILPDDVSPHAVEGFLDMLFERDDSQLICQNPLILLEILTLTHLYQMPRLTEQILELITCIPQESLNVSLAVSIFGAGERYEIPDLKFRAMQWMRINREVMVSNKGKGELDKHATNTPRIFSAFVEWMI